MFRGGGSRWDYDGISPPLNSWLDALLRSVGDQEEEPH